jgi:lambda family phage portal protein
MVRPNSGPTLAETFSGLRDDLNAARSSRFRRRRTGLATMGSGADYHYRSEADYLKVMEYARDMALNDCMVGQTIDRAVTNIVQDGIPPDPQTGDTGVDRDLKSRWADWSDDPDQCDLAGERSFNEIEHIVERGVFVDGDVFVLPNESGALELVEAHRCRTPSNTTRNVVHGVLLDPSTRKRLQYWFTKDDVDPNTIVSKVADIKAIDARDPFGRKQVFHVLLGKRASQTRGITALAPIFDVAGMYEDINFARLVQQQVVSCFAIFRKLAMGADFPTNMGQVEDKARSAHSRREKDEEPISPGMIIRGTPGEEISAVSSNVPNPEFFDHVRLILTTLGINLGLPLVMVLMDASETNFSGWRGAMDQARMGFRQNQRRLIARFHRPVYRWKVRQWAEEDKALQHAAGRGIDIYKHRWKPPSWQYVQPLADASADSLRLRNGLASNRQIASENGGDWNDQSTDMVNDRAELIVKAILKAQEINQQFPTAGITWRDLAPTPTAEGIQIGINAADGTQTDPPPPARKAQKNAA